MRKAIIIMALVGLAGCVPKSVFPATMILLSTQDMAEVCVQGGQVWASRSDHSCHVSDRDSKLSVLVYKR